jgi:2-dehydro-3-deoxyglucarate aldolase
MKALKDKLKQGRLTLGSWITMGHPAVAEIMAGAGFDWLTVDMEHSAIGIAEAQHLIQVIELCGVAPLVRVGHNDPLLIKRVMDAGAHGVIVPMVNTRQDAIRAVESVKYPPVGKRGVGLARAQGYGLGFEKYRECVNTDSVVIIQVEHIEAVENLEALLGVEGVDGFIVGPYDLSASMGMPGEFDRPEVVDAIARVMKIAGRFDVVPGFHVIPPDAQRVLEKIGQGYRFIGFSLDTLFLGSSCTKEVAEIKKSASGTRGNL